MSAVALANGLNANMVRRWVDEAEHVGPPKPSRRVASPPASALAPKGFVALPLPAGTPAADIRVEVRRAQTTITVCWPSTAAAECATWLREILK